MKEKPILFSAPMVRAILEGRKTQTRRIVKPQPLWVADPSVPFKTADCDPRGIIRCPYGQPGDRIWVRETWAYHPDFPEATHRAIYRAEKGVENDVDRWRPSIHMPRWASRILLEVTGIRVERLNDISEVDSLSEGILSVRSDEFEADHFKDWKKRFDAAVSSGEKPPVGPSPKESFKVLWESINGTGSWEANPFVWVIEFKRIDNA